MGFTFRKLYPTIAQIRNCCGVVCECVIPHTDDGEFCVTWNSDETCRCPDENIETGTTECNENNTCTIEICNGDGFETTTEVCMIIPGVECVCSTPYTSGTCFCVEGEDPNGECCPNFSCLDGVYNGRGAGAFWTIFDECLYIGAVPRTYKFEGIPSPGSITKCKRTLPANTEIFPNGMPYTPYNVSGQPGLIGDPEFTPARYNQRFYKIPFSGTVQPKGITQDYSYYCLKIHETDTQKRGIENRLMVISSINNYRYAGLLSGDPLLAGSDIFWDDPSPGGSGIKQYETLIIEGGQPREFPLPDRILGLPLWGEEDPTNLGLEPIDCITPYCLIGERQICKGCRCLQTDASELPFAVGHYMTNDPANAPISNLGYTAGYFSFAEFNPHSYLDHVTVTVNNNVSTTLSVTGGEYNLLGFGAMSDTLLPSDTSRNSRCNCQYSGGDLINCEGMSGATSHGPRLGVPTCSVWSLVKALYSRVLKAYTTSGWGLFETGGTPLTEQNFRSNTFTIGGAAANFSRFATEIDNLLSADPNGTTPPPSGWSVGTSLVHFHFAKVQEALKLDSAQFITALGRSINNDHFLFTFPNVLLWDPEKYVSASNSDKWKHLYVIGNANIIHDTRSIAVTGPYEMFRYPTADPATPIVHNNVADQNWLSNTFVMRRWDDSGYRYSTGDPGSPETNESADEARARIFLFNGSGGTASVGDVPENRRRNASSKVTLVLMPVCAEGLTDHPCLNEVPTLNNTMSPCNICNAFPNPMCFYDRDLASNPAQQWSEPGIGCEPLGNGCVVTELHPLVAKNMCAYRGGFVFETNSLTASYRIQ